MSAGQTPEDAINTVALSSSRTPNPAPALLGIASALLLTLAYPSLRWSWLAWVALSPLYLGLVRSRRKRDGAWIGFGFGFGLFLVGATWITVTGVPGWIILSFLMGILFALFGVVTAVVLPRIPEKVRPLVFAALWVLTEWVRSQGGYAFPWFVLAATQAHSLEVLQIVSVTGQWGLSFAIALTSALAGEAWLQRRRRRSAGVLVGVTVAVWAALFVFGKVELAREDSRHRENRWTVGVAQGNCLYPENGDRDAWQKYSSDCLTTYLQLTLNLSEQASTDTDLILWPEGAAPDELLVYNFSLPSIVRLVREIQTPLIVGTVFTDDSGQRFNSAVLIDKEGMPSGRYDKVHIVPLGEFFPARPLLHSIYLLYGAPESDFSAGRLPNVLNITGRRNKAKAGMLICYDVAFPSDSRQAVLKGAQFLAQITSDNPFEKSNRPEQHADLTALRTVETRRWMVRAAFSGISQAVDPTGREASRIPVLTRDSMVVSQVDLRDDETLFVRWGDWFVGVCAVIGMGALIAVWRVRRADASGGASPPD